MLKGKEAIDNEKILLSNVLNYLLWWLHLFNLHPLTYPQGDSILSNKLDFVFFNL